MIRKLFFLCAVCLVLFACDKSTEPKYTIPTPTFSWLTGQYFDAIEVQINCRVDGASIRYTLDGTEPGTNSALYDANVPIVIMGATTLKAKAYKNKMKTSATATAVYTFGVGTIYMEPRGGSFTHPQLVTLTRTTENTNIYYTTDGTEPTEQSMLYTVPFTLDGDAVLKAKGFISSWSPSTTVSYAFTFNAIQPTFDVTEGTYNNDVTLSMSSGSEGASIYYTLNGTDPTEASLLYSNPILINTSKTVKAKAFKNNWTASAITSGTYTLKANDPVISPPSAVYYTPQNISISCSTPNANIYYTTNGVDPTTNSTHYTAPFNVSTTLAVKAIAVKTGWSNSNISASTYSFNVSTPTFDPLPGSYIGSTEVSIACVTPGAQIHYTVNSLEPTINSPLYSVPIAVSVNSTIRAKAFKDGMNPSELASGYFQIANVVATPTFDPPAGTYYQPTDVTILCATPGATIRYTVDGSEPNATSFEFVSPLAVDAPTVIKAKAYKFGMTTSPTASSAYEFDTLNQIVAWGRNDYNQCTVPPGNDFTKIDAGMYHAVGLKTDGSLVAWGRNNYGQTAFPAGNSFTAISAGDNHNLALKTDGSIVAWGRVDSLQCDIPPDSLGYTYSAVAAGANHSLALRSNGMLVAWGANYSGQCNVPTGNNFVKIAAGANHNVALRADGTMVSWGNNDNGQINTPSGSFYADITAGDQHCIAKKTDNSLIGWGNNLYGQTNAPTGTNFTKIAAGYRHNLALKSNGTLATWGYGDNGLGTVPTTTTYIDIAAGRDFSVVLKTSTVASRKNSLKYLKPKFKL